ncbi:MAG: glycosyltransferase family 4 protein [Bacteroidales bacterium]|nr:glycosyltransferase family 4 protein [Bacteroidales bacterium]MCF8403126.1 glycosyltransferase family 4 protein [Bacteroidales bacterium]
MTPLKICHITTVHPARDTRIFYKESKSLAAAGFKVTLIAVNGESFIEDEVEVIGIACNYSGRVQRFLKASKAAFRLALEVDADIYHFHDPEFLPWAAKLIRRGKKVIYDVHEDLPRQMLSKYWIPLIIRKPGSKLIEALEKYYSSKMSGIVTATTFIRDRFLRFHKMVIEIQNFPTLKLLEETQSLGEKGNELCYIGGITKVRGISELVKSMSIVKSDVRLNLAGKIDPHEYRSELNHTPGWEKVNELGFANRKQVKEILQRSFAGLATLHPIINYVDALPVKMFEYMAAGIPVIVSDIPLWKQIITDNDCGIAVDPLNPEQIAEAIDYLSENPGKTKEKGQNGIKAIREKFNWELEEKKLVGFYKSVVAQ